MTTKAATLPRRLWKAFIRLLIMLLLLAAAAALYLSLNPEALAAVLINVPGHVAAPDLGPVPPQPQIAAPRGALPSGFVAFTGETSGNSFACGFLLEMEDGKGTRPLRVGVSAAHATPVPLPGATSVFRAPDGSLVANLDGQIARGSTFRHAHFTMDYALWSVAGDVPAERFLKPDPRGAGQPGERILVYGRFTAPDGGSKSWPGVVMKITADATWIQLDEELKSYGFSGCPVVSQYTGQVIGMAVAGWQKTPSRMGLHPIGSLVEKARKAIGSNTPSK
jgi:hypothetical protein